MPFQTILVPVDFSDSSHAAFETAIQLAAESKGRLHLLHAYQIIIPTPAIMAPGIPADLMTSVRETAAEKLAEWVAHAGRAGVEAEAHLSPASPSQAIETAVDELGADLIVMGTRGLSGLQHVLLGSIAERTVRSASCPVLTVKGKE